MRRFLLFLFWFMACTVPVQAAQKFQQEALFTGYNQSGYTWGNNGFERYLWLGAYKIRDRGQGTYVVEKDKQFIAYQCDISAVGPPLFSGCTKHGSILNSATSKHEVNISESAALTSNVFLGTMKEEIPPGDGGTTNPGDGGTGGGNVGGTLPDYTLTDDPTFLATLWNYTGSMFKLGMPLLMISVALLLIEPIAELIISAMKARRRKDDDDDDW